MSVYALEKFENFTRKMYHLNCEERGDWGEELLTYEQYTETYRKFLLESYQNLQDQSFGEALEKGGLKEWMRTL